MKYHRRVVQKNLPFPGRYHMPRLLAPITNNSTKFNYIVEEWANGGDLFNWIHGRNREHRPEEFSRLLLHLLTALEHMHHFNIVHRDIKLENVVLGNLNGYVSPAGGRMEGFMLIDFGRALRLGHTFPDADVLSWCSPPEVLFDNVMADGNLRFTSEDSWKSWNKFLSENKPQDKLLDEKTRQYCELLEKKQRQYCEHYKLLDVWGVCLLVMGSILHRYGKPGPFQFFNERNFPDNDKLEGLSAEAFMNCVKNWLQDVAKLPNFVSWKYMNVFVGTLKCGLRRELDGKDRRMNASQLLQKLAQGGVSYALAPYTRRFEPDARAVKFMSSQYFKS
ncbi:hypothetical protein T439DRAFT_360838 [Meredithblackwellia eburnea MCA 4105]